MLDYGQVKDLPEALRLGYANLVLAIADGDIVKASESYRYKSLISNIYRKTNEKKSYLFIVICMFIFIFG